MHLVLLVVKKHVSGDFGRMDSAVNSSYSNWQNYQ